MSARYIVGDVHEVLASIPENSVDLVMSSPPFLALRSYLPSDHPDKAKEIGSEATPGEFIDAMLDVVEACARVLAPHGSLVFELGDTYAGSGGAGGDYAEGGLRDGQPQFDGSARRGNQRVQREGYASSIPSKRTEGVHWSVPTHGTGWPPLDKSKVLIPQLFAVALSYGFNPLTGRTTDPWRVRNTVAWCRPNPPVGRDGDKFRPATSFLTVACKARDRYWDGDAVRVPSQDTAPRNTNGPKSANADSGDVLSHYDTRTTNPAGAPLLDWWEIPTAPYKGSHYATYPPGLVVPVVKSMSPERVCTVCGKPSTRIVHAESFANGELRTENLNGRSSIEPWRDENENRKATGATFSRTVETLGWSDCGHDSWRAGMVLDPFAGSGTTLQVAAGHGREAIGIDLDSRNADLAVERIGGLFLSVEHFEACREAS